MCSLFADATDVLVLKHQAICILNADYHIDWSIFIQEYYIYTEKQ